MHHALELRDRRSQLPRAHQRRRGALRPREHALGVPVIFRDLFRLGELPRGGVEVLGDERGFARGECLRRGPGVVVHVHATELTLVLGHHRAEFVVDVGDLQSSLARQSAVVRCADERDGLQRREVPPVAAAPQDERGGLVRGWRGRRLGGDLRHELSAVQGLPRHQRGRISAARDLIRAHDG